MKKIENEKLINNSNKILELKDNIKYNQDNKYSKIHNRFIDFYLTHDLIFVQKNRRAGFSEFMEEIAIAESQDNKKVLLLQCGGEKHNRVSKNCDYKNNKEYTPNILIGKRYDVIIIDEIYILKNFERLLDDITPFLSNSKIIIATTPSPQEKLKKIFEDAELNGNLFHFNYWINKDNMYNIIKRNIDNIDCIANEVFGVFLEYKENNNEIYKQLKKKSNI